MEDDKIYRLEKKVAEMQKRLDYYESDGSVRLFYALNRKQNEMADLLNNQSLTTIDLADGKDKSFERMKMIWTGTDEIAKAIRTLGEMNGIIKADEEGESSQNQPKFRKVITAESMADDVGEIAGSKKQ